MVSDKQFSMGEALRFGWRMTFSHFWFFLGVMLVSGVVQIAPNVLYRLVEGRALLSFAIAVVFFVLFTIIQMGFLNITIRFARNAEAHFADLFAVSHLFFKFLVAHILFSLLVFVGLLLLIVPGIIWAIKYQFFSYFIVGEGIGPLKALKRSGDITRGVKWPLFLFGLLLALVNLLGVLALFIGWIVTIPMTMLATAYVYRKLVDQTYGAEHEPSQPESSPTPTTA